jgi:hypothetical protein
MSESSDYSPGEWVGYDFTAAKKTYDVHVGRSYSDAKADHKRAADLVPAMISTESKAPLSILIDVTGSMGSWPATMFSKLPYMEISFSAVGDAHSDEYPIQVRPFSKGRDLESELKELVIEGGGGGQDTESYELTALYYARNVKMPNAIKPILILIGDESYYSTISKVHAKLAHVTLEEYSINTKDVFKELREKYSVYLIRKPYDRDDSKIRNKWIELLGEERIATLPSADRVVDVIFGILAKEKNMVSYFKKEIEERQRKDQVDTVYKSLETIHLLPTNSESSDGKSVFHTNMKGKPTKHLLT